MKFESKHGHAKSSRGACSPEYRCWGGIKSRCLTPTHPEFKNYGAKGVSICDEWRDDFVAFFDYVGPRPSPLHSIDRYPNRNGNYEPGNVRWATKKEQTHNRDYTRSIDGTPLTEIARQRGISYAMVRGRIARGWSFEKAISEPFRYLRGKRGCATSPS